MDRYGVRTKTDAVALALRHLAGVPMTRQEALAMRGAHAIEDVPTDSAPWPLGLGTACPPGVVEKSRGCANSWDDQR